MKLQKSGINIELVSGKLKLPANMAFSEEVGRRAKDLSAVLYANPLKPENVIYRVWKNVRKTADENQINKVKLSYDITVIYPGKIGREFPKTFGHYHSEDIAGTGYPELYDVLSGRAWFLIQRPAKLNPKKLEEIYLIEANEGEKVIVPPGFGHIAINPDIKDLALANWRASNFIYDYESYSNLRGSGYYVMESKNGASADFEKNRYYEMVPDLKKISPKPVPELGIITYEPAYDMIKKPERLLFLVKPEKYLDILTIKKCFK